jgi:sugar lactone lactonase YvrE
LVAKYLALSKDESTIYFSDSRANAIRKIVLR